MIAQLVPKETPWGPPEARLAWADALGSVLIVLAYGDGGMRVRVNVPSEGRSLWLDTAELLAEYEDADAAMPQGWDGEGTIRRAALAAAQAVHDSIETVADLADPARWEAAARAVIRTHIERGVAQTMRDRKALFGW